MKPCFCAPNRLVFIALPLLVFLMHCSSTRPGGTAPDPASGEPRPAGFDESFDPMTLEGDDLTFPEGDPVEPIADPAAVGSAAGAVDSRANREMDGFRVQLFATRDIERATLTKNEAEYIFAEDGDTVAVYLTFDSPNWKVRVGDCLTRDQAEALRLTARRKGYSGAFIVKARVNTIPSLPDLTPREPDRID